MGEIDYEALRKKALDRADLGWEFADGVDAHQQALQDFLQDKIVLDREEVRAAREKALQHSCQVHGCFLRYDQACNFTRTSEFCQFCRLLTEFAKGGEDD